MFGWLRAVILFCSGVNRELLERPECAIDYSRFQMIGTMVLLNATFAGVAATDAIYQIFQSVGIAIFLGTLWAIAMLFLDRIIVAPLPKRAMPTRLSFWERVRFRSRDLASVIPRLVLATVIGLTIAAPLELRFFEPLITAELASRRVVAELRAEKVIRTEFAEIERLEQENIQRQKQVARLRTDVRARLRALLEEPSESQLALRRNEYRLAANRLTEAEVLSARDAAQNTATLGRLREAARQREAEILRATPPVNSAGLLQRAKVLDDLNATKDAGAIRAIGTSVSLLFVMTQMAPILIKLLAPSGAYEYFWEALEVMSARDRLQGVGSGTRAAANPDLAQLIVDVNQRCLVAFLCHSSDDKPAVRSLAQRLHHDGVDVWLDEERLLPGQDWDAEIVAAVRASDVVIVCLSSTSVKKTGYVQKEVRLAVEIAGEQPERSIFLIPAKLTECEIPPSLYKLQFVRMVDAFGYDQLMRSLERRAEQKGLRLSRTS